MSETNGHRESRFEDMEQTLKQLHASHVQLMTDHEVFVREHEKFIAEQDREWKWQQERWRQYDLQRRKDRKRERLRGAEVDKRIAELVSAFGAFVVRVEGKPAKNDSEF